MRLFPLLFLTLTVSAESEESDELEFVNFGQYQPEQTRLTIGENGQGIVVSWTTWNDTGKSLVEFGTHVSELDQTAIGVSRIFVDGGLEARRQFIHTVKLEQLHPNTIYLYHVGSDLGWSDLFWFRTYPTNKSNKWSPRLAVYGDLGNTNAQSLPRLQKEAQAGVYDAVIHVGDFAYDLHENNGRVGDEFLRQIEAVAAYVPYITCPGNHEQMYNFSNYKARFTMPGGDNMFFSFDLGPVHFLSISTEFYYFMNYGMKMVAKQYQWIVEDLKRANLPENRSLRPWIVMFGHRPMYCSTDDGDDCGKRDTYTRVGIPVLRVFGLEQLLYENNVDLAIWAHEHNYERFWPLYDYHVHNGSTKAPYEDPKATVHITVGSAGCRERHDSWRPQPDYSAYRSSDYGYARITAHNATHMEIEEVSDDKDGEVIDHFWIVSHHHRF